jgi:hypothetical protein
MRFSVIDIRRYNLQQWEICDALAQWLALCAAAATLR